MEDWKQIKEYPYYMVSNLGRVKSLRFNKERIVNGGIDTRGYKMVNLVNELGRKSRLVHRLVAKEFIANVDNKKCVNHLNGIKTDNRSDNLAWCTQQENVIHSYTEKLAIGKIGVINGRSVLTEDQVLEIRAIEGVRVCEIALKYNVSWGCINRVVKRETWTHI